MIENLNGYIYDSFFKIKVIKASKKKNIPESKITHFFYRIKSGNSTITLMSIEDIPDFRKGTEFEIEISNKPLSNNITNDQFICSGQVKGCKEKVGKNNDHYIYSIQFTDIFNKPKLHDVNMNLELDSNELTLLESCYMKLTNLHTIKKEILNNGEDPNQKKLDSFLNKEDMKGTLSIDEKKNE